jgi:glycosyltransferase involved in cell wall biosynthesis
VETKKNILILCSRLDLPGGIERAIVNTANLLQEKGHDVSILILDTTATSFFPLNEQVKIAHENLNFGIIKTGNFISRKLDFFRHIKTLKQKFKELSPGVILSTEYPFTIAAYLAAGKLKTKIFAWEHHHFYHLPKSGFWKRMHKWVYPKANGVICLNEDEARLYQSLQCKTTVIPNFIEQNEKARLTAKTFITVGWLSKTKGVDLIPSIAEKVFAKHPGWNWKIIGTGDEEQFLKQELKNRNLEKYVSVIAPTTHDLRNEYLSSSMYVMTSRFECFPMVLLEAMSHGLSCIAFDCPTGPRHIITNDENGFLIKPDDIDAFVNAIDELIVNDEKRKSFGMKAYESILQFHPDRIYKLWENVFAE